MGRDGDPVKTEAEHVITTEAEDEARIRAARTRTALQEAPHLARHLRTQILHTDGRSERGEAFAHKSTPLNTRLTDASDELYVLLLDWVSMWVSVTGANPPATAAVAWRNYRENDADNQPKALGLKAGTTVKGAGALVEILTMWLLSHQPQFEHHPEFVTYQDEVCTIVWRLRSSSGLTTARKAAEASPRPCPACGEHEMRAEYFGSSFEAAEARGDLRRDQLEAVDGIEVRCSACGHTERASATKIAKWLS